MKTTYQIKVDITYEVNLYLLEELKKQILKNSKKLKPKINYNNGYTICYDFGSRLLELLKTKYPEEIKIEDLTEVNSEMFIVADDGKKIYKFLKREKKK